MLLRTLARTFVTVVTCASVGMLMVDAASAERMAGLERYRQVLIDPLEIQYTDEFLADRKTRRHAIGKRDLVRFQQRYQAVVEKTLGPDFPVTDKPGPGVLRIDAVLLDHAMDKSHWWTPAKQMFSSPTRVYLVAALRDSQTGKILHRVGLDLRPRGNRLMQQGPVEYWNFMRQVFNRIAVRVRWSLEDSAVDNT